ncbi:hypothetical protein D3C80_964930 [compost metagenome]
MISFICLTNSVLPRNIAFAFSGVAIMTSESSMIFSSSLLYKLPPYRCETEMSALSNIGSKVLSTSKANDLNGAIYNTLFAGSFIIQLSMAISAILVLPLLVGMLMMQPFSAFKTLFRDFLWVINNSKIPLGARNTNDLIY